MCAGARRRQHRQLPVFPVIVALALAVALPAWIGRSPMSDRHSDWQVAVYRFDTGVITACEIFAREIGWRLSADSRKFPDDLWNRMSSVRPAPKASADCLIQAGLMAL